MSGRGSHVDSRIMAVVDFMMRCPGAKVPEAMLAKNFSLAESSNLVKRHKEAIKKRDAASSREIVLSSPSMTVSPLTGDTTSTAVVTAGGHSTSLQPPSTPTTPGSRSSPRLIKQKPKLHLTRKNARAMQNNCVNKLTTSDFMTRAFKRATNWYSGEMKITNGKSSYEIARLVRIDYDGIRWYINANLSGMSPLKLGVKGDVPARA
jgi:hypothetical protein